MFFLSFRERASSRKELLDEKCGVVGILFREKVPALHRLSVSVRSPLTPDTQWASVFPIKSIEGTTFRPPTLTDVSQKSSLEDIIRRSSRSSFMDSFRIVDKRDVWNELQEARLAVVIQVWIASI